FEYQIGSILSVHDVIPQERLNTLLKSNIKEITLTDLQEMISYKQDVVECKQLLYLFRTRITERQERLGKIQRLQKLLLTSSLFDEFLKEIADIGIEYFTEEELNCLEEAKIIDIGTLAMLLSLPKLEKLDERDLDDDQKKFLHSSKQQQLQRSTQLSTAIDRTSLSSIKERQRSNPITKYPRLTYLHILDPMIKKFSLFMTSIMIRIISKKDAFNPVIETLLNNSNDYLSAGEVLEACEREQILPLTEINRICQEAFYSDCEQQPRQSEPNSSRDQYSTFRLQSSYSQRNASENINSVSSTSIRNNSHVQRRPIYNSNSNNQTLIMPLSFNSFTNATNSIVNRSQNMNVSITKGTDNDRQPLISGSGVITHLMSTTLSDFTGRTSHNTHTAFDCYNREIHKYSNDINERHKMDQNIILRIFDRILYFNHRTIINNQLKHFLGVLKPLEFILLELLDDVKVAFAC
ncbi:unnamed protein product, partial [Didymodactylos carnosus]